MKYVLSILILLSLFPHSGNSQINSYYTGIDLSATGSADITVTGQINSFPDQYYYFSEFSGGADRVIGMPEFAGGISFPIQIYSKKNSTLNG